MERRSVARSGEQHRVGQQVSDGCARVDGIILRPSLRDTRPCASQRSPELKCVDSEGCSQGPTGTMAQAEERTERTMERSGRRVS